MILFITHWLHCTPAGIISTKLKCGKTKLFIIYLLIYWAPETTSRALEGPQTPLYVSLTHWPVYFRLKRFILLYFAFDINMWTKTHLKVIVVLTLDQQIVDEADFPVGASQNPAGPYFSAQINEIKMGGGGRSLSVIWANGCPLASGFCVYMQLIKESVSNPRESHREGGGYMMLRHTMMTATSN